MADDKVAVFWIFSKENCSALCCVKEWSSMETVAAGSVLLVPFAWNCILESFFRHCLVPCCIHDCWVRNIWHYLLSSFNTHDVSRHVERSQVYYLAEAFQNLWSDKNRLCELFATMKYAVTNSSNFFHRFDYTNLRVSDFFNDKFDCFFVSWTRAFDFCFLSLSLVSNAASFNSDALHNTVSHYFFVVPVINLILCRWWTAVQC